MMFPPGRARLATKPASTGSIKRTPMTIGMLLVACWAARSAGVPDSDDDINLEPDELGGKRGKAIGVTFSPAVLDVTCLALDPAQVAEALSERLDARGQRLRVCSCRCIRCAPGPSPQAAPRRRAARRGGHSLRCR